MKSPPTSSFPKIQLRRSRIPSHRTPFQPRTLSTTHPILSSHPTQPSSSNRILNPILTPPTFHDYLRLSSANNTLLLLLFTTSAARQTSGITPLLTDLVNTRSVSSGDKFSSLSYAELELDSPDTSNGSNYDLGVEYGVTNVPSLVGFGGRRAERVTERLDDEMILMDRTRVGRWVDEQMVKGDGFGTGGLGGGADSGGWGFGLLKRLFG